eukprot:1307139-Rhodomonas_salina.1
MWGTETSGARGYAPVPLRVTKLDCQQCKPKWASETLPSATRACSGEVKASQLLTRLLLSSAAFCTKAASRTVALLRRRRGAGATP